MNVDCPHIKFSSISTQHSARLSQLCTPPILKSELLILFIQAIFLGPSFCLQ